MVLQHPEGFFLQFLLIFQGAKLQIQSLQTTFLVKAMDPIPGTDEYRFSGKFPDIWSALQIMTRIYKFYVSSLHPFHSKKVFNGHTFNLMLFIIDSISSLSNDLEMLEGTKLKIVSTH